MFVNATISALIPQKITAVTEFYKNFFFRYSLIMRQIMTINALIDVAGKEKVAEMQAIWMGLLDDYQYQNSMAICMGISYDIPQLRENRGLWTESTQGVNSKEKLVTSVNLSEYLQLYSLFEDSISKLLHGIGILKNGKYLKEKDVIKKFNEFLTKEGIKKEFYDTLSARTPFQSDMELFLFWHFFTIIRNILVHADRLPSAKEIASFEKCKEKITTYLQRDAILITFICDTLDEVAVTPNVHLTVTDKMVNMLRNYIVYIMESLYLVRLR